LKKIISIIGARPQFIKAAPIEVAIAEHKSLKHYSVHTGQHYDPNMSDIFFNELGLETPHINLNVGSGTHASQTAQILLALDPVLDEINPDLLIVYGDTNSTLAATLCAVKKHIPVAHIEAGLRSFNRAMPEEINRVLTDHASTLLYAPTQVAIDNLKQEGIENAEISGDVMLDMILLAKGKLNMDAIVKDFYYVTIHRPYNTDNPARMLSILNALNSLKHRVIFSVHPRTMNLLQAEYKMNLGVFGNIEFIEPQGYFENLKYLTTSEAIITDSGGMQKEAYFLKKQCVTVRSETEWIETLANNCNQLVWETPSDILKALNVTPGNFIENIYGKGDAAKNIVASIYKYLYAD